MRQLTIASITLFAFAVGALVPAGRAPSSEAEVLGQVVSAEPLAHAVWVEVPVPTPDPTPRPVVTAAPKAKAATPVRTAAPKPKRTAPPATPKPAVHRTTTPASVKPAKTPAPVQRTWSVEEVKSAIREVWAADDDEAIAVVDCETAGTFDPRMTSSNGMYKGLWQFHQDTWERWGGSGDPRDASPSEQTRIARKLYEAKGWAPWPSCGSQ